MHHLHLWQNAECADNDSGCNKKEQYFNHKKKQHCVSGFDIARYSITLPYLNHIFYDFVSYLFTGKGVFATRPFSKGDFLLQYRGQIRKTVETENDDQTFIFHFFIGRNKVW